MIYNLSRSAIEGRGLRGRRVVSETDSTYTVRVLDMFDLVILKDDESLTPCLVREGYWEAWITSWVTRWLRPGQTFIDVGANCGYYTMLAEKLVGRHGHVVAYEPSPVYAELLRKTREINGADFSLRNVALSDSVGHVTLSVPGNLHGSATITHSFKDTQWGESAAYDVRTTTLDNELQRIVFWNADVVKIDAEGAEELVWKGGQTLFNAEGSHSTIMLEWTPGAYSSEFLEALYDWGYVFSITFDGGEVPATREFIQSLTDWHMLVVRRKLY